MPDREKVIKGLECCTFILGKRKCNECPYQKGLPDNGCYQLQDDFHTMLKEQEAVEPKQVDLYGKDEWWGLVCVCPDCKAEWMSDKADTHFCPKCGQAVKWE